MAHTAASGPPENSLLSLVLAQLPRNAKRCWHCGLTEGLNLPEIFPKGALKGLPTLQIAASFCAIQVSTAGTLWSQLHLSGKNPQGIERLAVRCCETSHRLG